MKLGGDGDMCYNGTTNAASGLGGKVLHRNRDKAIVDPESCYSTHAATDLHSDLVLGDPGAAANPEWLCLSARLGECVPRGGDADHVNQSGETQVALLSDPHETPMGRP